MKTLNFAYVFLIALSLSGCGAIDYILLIQASENEIPGTYIGEYPYAKETIIIAADHTFTQEVYVTEKKETFRTRGTWILDKNAQIELENAFWVNGYFGGTIHPSFGKPQRRYNGIYRYRLSKKVCFGAGDEYGPCTVQ